MTMTEEIEQLHMLKKYRPSKEALEYAKMLEEVYQKLIRRRACLDAMMPRERFVKLVVDS